MQCDNIQSKADYSFWLWSVADSFTCHTNGRLIFKGAISEHVSIEWCRNSSTAAGNLIFRDNTFSPHCLRRVSSDQQYFRVRKLSHHVQAILISFVLSPSAITHIFTQDSLRMASMCTSPIIFVQFVGGDHEDIAMYSIGNVEDHSHKMQLPTPGLYFDLYN